MRRLYGKLFCRNFENATDLSFTGGTADSFHYVKGEMDNDYWSSYTGHSYYLGVITNVTLSQNEKN